MIAATPAAPYYAVIFTSLRTADSGATGAVKASGEASGSASAGGGDNEAIGYEAMAQRMLELAARQPGFLGVESARDSLGITVSYWASLEAIRAWKLQVDHLEAQRRGRSDWYRAYRTRICLVEREYGFDAGA